MKISKLVLISMSALGLAVTALSGGFYALEQAMMLHTVANELNQSTFLLEENARRALQNGRAGDLQALLDQTFALNDALAEVSISTDSRHINVSSTRSRIGAPIDNEYLPLSQLYDGLLSHHSAFRNKFYYFEGANKREALMLIRVDEGYVFGRLNQIAILYGIETFLTLGLLSMLLFSVIRRMVVTPLVNITQHAHTGSVQHATYFIGEFSELDRTLSDTFLSMHRQQHDLQEAFDETSYLDGILRTVADINQLLISARTIEELISKSVSRLAEHPGYALCWLALENRQALELRAYSTDATQTLNASAIMAHTSDPDEDNPVAQAFNRSKSIVIDHLEPYPTSALWRQVANRGGYGSFITLPLLPSIHEKPAGVLGLYALRANGFKPKEVAMLEELAGDIGLAIRSFSQREQLEHHLTTDTVTGLPNRISLVDKLAINSDVTLALINIDRFSDLNSVYGVTIGDGILAKYGQWLLRLIKPYDDISLFKMGSDEYALVFNRHDEIEQHKIFLEQLIALSAREAFVIDEIEVMLTVTIGMAVASGKILEHATIALKQAKQAHRSMQIYEATSSRQDQENNIAWYKRIRDAIDESRIVPFFQPIVDNQTGRIVKYEALVRLIERNGNIVVPHQFLAISKKTRLYGQLTKMMFDKVAEVFGNSSIPVSINLSTEDLLNDELAEYLEQQILARQIGKLIIFEILESEGIENYAEVSAFVDRFKAIGCHFAIDDFGTGYSNFDHLLKLNIDTLKIDGSLIKNLPHDHNTQIIVKHIRDFAHEMGISTVAEFVANEAIYNLVRGMGIDASQGYYFYEPAAALVKE